MSLAAEEEAKLAIANGDVREDGIPMITVIADGAWSKKSYKSNYNVRSCKQQLLNSSIYLQLDII